MAVSRRAFLGTSGAIGAGTLLASLGAPLLDQWSSPFTGLTGWADVNGPGLIGLDADFLIASSYASDDERRTTVGLFTIAGSPICISDTVDTIGDSAWVFQNPEVIALNKDGLAGKPLFNNNHGYNWDTGSRDTERWIGQLSNGSWIVGLFNRGQSSVSAPLLRCTSTTSPSTEVPAPRSPADHCPLATACASQPGRAGHRHDRR